MIKVNRNSKGFTLIELLIVIAIIGILAAIAIPAYTGYTKKSKMSGVTSAMGALKNAVIAYYTETGRLTDAADLATIGTSFGINIPTQYISAANVVVNAAGGVVITATQSIQPGDVNLTTANLSNGANWTWGASTAAITAILPKN